MDMIFNRYERRGGRTVAVFFRVVYDYRMGQEAAFDRQSLEERCRNLAAYPAAAEDMEHARAVLNNWPDESDAR